MSSSIIIIQKEAIKRVFKSKLTWLLIILWTLFFLTFIILRLENIPLFSNQKVLSWVYLIMFLTGIGGLVFFRYNLRLHLSKIMNQNQLLQQRERMMAKTNDKLIRQSNFLKLVTDSFAHPFFVIDADSYEIVIANKAFYQYHGLPENTKPYMKKCFDLSHQFQHPCNGTKHPCPLMQVKETGKSVTCHHKHKDQEENDRIMEITAFPVFEEETGRVKQLIEYNVDITERVNEQFILAEKEERLRTIITTSPDGIAVTNLDGTVTFASEKAAMMLGYNTPDQILGINAFDFIAPEDVERARNAIDDLIGFKSSFETQEFRTIRKDGSSFYQESNVSLLFDKENNPTALVLVTRDITERKITQEKLLSLNKELEEKSLALEQLNKSLEIRIKQEVEESREKDRMIALQSRQAAMGEMIGNIAHQWRQPLNTLNLIIFDLVEAQQHGELNQTYLQNSYNEINKVVQTMSQTIDDFRNFFKPNKEQKVFDINKVIDQSLSLTETGFSAENISITFDKNGPIEAQGYPNELMQTLINIFNNARDALIAAKSDPKKINIHCLKETDIVIIEISNNGGNILHDELDKIFDPYYSTKPEGKGTGLGLFISKTIIEKNMNGKLTASNTKDGVCFRIELKAYTG
jgi:PAS domain S-box-containing protein